MAVAAAALLLMASCGTTKKMEGAGKVNANDKKTETKAEQSAALRNLAFVQKVSDNQVYTNNIVGNMNFNLQAADKDITVPGKLSMRKDEVIRIQLFIPILGTEVGRLEFTPNYVLIIDRLHKEYIKASYKEVSFLADNGISFYSLQSLFWNELFLPGENHITERLLDRLTCELAQISTDVPVTYKKGNISYLWTASKATANIKAVDVKYSSQQYGTSSLHWTYDNFRTVGGKAFPLTQQFNVTMGSGAKQKSAQLTVKMSSPKTTSDWDAKTEISAKYKKIEAKDILGKLLSIQ